MVNNFEFYAPTRVVFGRKTEEQTGALVRQFGGSRVLIVYGGKSAGRVPAGAADDFSRCHAAPECVPPASGTPQNSAGTAAGRPQSGACIR